MGASASVDRPQLKLAADTAREGDVDSQLAALMIRTGWLGMGAGTVPSGTLGPSGKEDPYMSKQLPAPVRRELGVPQRYSRAEAIACTSRWLIKTAKKVAEEKRSAGPDVDAIKCVLGSGEFFVGLDEVVPQSGGRKSQCQVALQGIAEGVLASIATAGERDIYVGRGLAQKLGSVGKAFPGDGTVVRLDDAGVLGSALTDVVYGHENMCWVLLTVPVDAEFMFIAAIAMMGVAVDHDFQRQIRALAADHGGGTVRVAPTKGFSRMMNKAHSDHANERKPRPACNIDISRNAVTFGSPEELAAGFEAVAARFPPLRVKNNFRPEFDAAKRSFGYRSVLVNMLYVPESKVGKAVTWGQLMADMPDAAWAKFSADAASSLGPGFAKRLTAWGKLLFLGEGREELINYPGLESCTNEALMNNNRRFVESLKKLLATPVRFIVETQFILTEYLEMRKSSHIWYKIFRADSATDLLADFKKYAIAYDEDESELCQAYVNWLRGDLSAYKKYAIGRRQRSLVGAIVDDEREDPSTSHRRRHRRRGRRRDVFNFTNVPRAVH